jgi:hypothetical protein
MKKIILFLGFSILGLFAFSQELTFDSLYYEPQIIDDTTTNYFVVHIKKYDNGNEITEKQFIGDSIQLVNYLYRETKKVQRERARYLRNVFERRFLGDHAKLLKDFSGDRFFVFSADRFETIFAGNYDVRTGGNIYECEVTKVGNNLKIEIDGVMYTMQINSFSGFNIIDYPAEGVDNEFFLLNEFNNKRVFVNNDNSIRVIKKIIVDDLPGN